MQDFKMKYVVKWDRFIVFKEFHPWLLHYFAAQYSSYSSQQKKAALANNTIFRSIIN